MTGSEPIPTGNVYDKYGTTTPIERRLVRGFLQRLDSYLDALDGVHSVLDVGCGEGMIATKVRESLPDASCWALDIDEELVAETAAVCPDTRCVAASAYDLPWGDDQFDLVLAMEVLEHLEDPHRALKEIARVSRRYVIASVPNEPLWRVLNMLRGAYLKDFGNTPGHVRHFSSGRFHRLLETELEIIDSCRPLPWLMALSRLR